MEEKRVSVTEFEDCCCQSDRIQEMHSMIQRNVPHSTGNIIKWANSFQVLEKSHRQCLEAASYTTLDMSTCKLRVCENLHSCFHPLVETRAEHVRK